MRSLRTYFWLFALLTLSGLLLMFLYVPNAVSTGQALAPQGLMIGHVSRGIHFWGAQFAVLVILVHLIRSAFVKTNRSLTKWAATLTLLTALLWFTGMLLPWDQLGAWVKNWFHGMSAQNALLIVYWLHSLVLPILTLPLLMSRVRRQRTT